MKKISLVAAILMAVTMFVGCESNSEQVASATPINTNNPVESQKAVVIPESSSTPTPIVEDNKAIIWGCEANVTENEDGTLTVDYVLTEVDGSETRQFSENPNFNKSWYEMFSGNGGVIYEIADYNFDGYLDIKTQKYGAFVNQYYNIRLWNVEVKEFELDSDFMNISNISLNTDKQQLFGVNYDRGLGNYALYNMVDGKLTIIAQIKVEMKSDGTFEYTQIIGDGEAVVVRNVSEIDAIWDGYNVQIVE